MKASKAFTLIELLVVISIISLLSSIVLASLSEARMKARDARRMSTLDQIQIALELYASENGGNYPTRFLRSPVAANEVGDPIRCGYGSTGTTTSGGNPITSSAYDGGLWCRLEEALADNIGGELPPSYIKGDTYYPYSYKLPLQNNDTYNPNSVNEYGLSVKLEEANDASRDDGGWHDDWYELGGLPRYCSDQGVTWYSWASIPCTCTTFYSEGCVY